MNALDKIRLAKKLSDYYGLFLKTLFAYLAFVGIFGFSLFIMEEASQVIMWANFSATDQHRFDLVKKNCEAIKRINQYGRTLNKYAGWLNPFQMMAYDAFHDGTDLYADTLLQQALAGDPSLFIGEKISVQINWISYEKQISGKVRLSARTFSCDVEDIPKSKTIAVTGVISVDKDNPGRLFLK